MFKVSKYKASIYVAIKNTNSELILQVSKKEPIFEVGLKTKTSHLDNTTTAVEKNYGKTPI